MNDGKIFCWGGILIFVIFIILGWAYHFKELNTEPEIIDCYDNHGSVIITDVCLESKHTIGDSIAITIVLVVCISLLVLLLIYGVD